MIELDKAYDHTKVEHKIYQQWLDSGYFNPDKLPPRHTEPYSIILPPPNVTGTLHVGHALMLVIQDILIRYHRMKGFKTLWLPGTDHAAIATQSKVEAEMYKKDKTTRHDLGREQFLEKVEAYAQTSHDTIVGQIKRMGASVDWSREAYTLDEARSLAVRTAFKRLYDMGLIYRGKRMVNWDPKLQTTVSDDEIEWQEQTSPFYYLKYGPFTIGTARPETKFGDKYVVMHPDDPRYQKYQHGQQLEVEWINGAVTATVIKDSSIDMEFGTGVMTITPWHDLADNEIAQRHNLDFEQIIDLHGKLLPIAEEFAGMHIKKARPAIIEKLQVKGLVEKIDEKYTHRIATNSRGGGVIEPHILEQWFIDVNKEFTPVNSVSPGLKVTLKQLMHGVVEDGLIKIIPEHFEKIYFHWIDNLRDWCISRQIWYGHRIPVWYKNNEQYVGIEPPVGEGWQQDPDTLDTWFSSGLWTFSTLGWPAEKVWDLKIYDSAQNFAALDKGTKRFETRAGTAPDSRRDWSQFKVGDVINFSLVEEGTEKVLSDKIITKQVASIHHFNSIDELLGKFNLKEIHPDKPEEYRQWWESRPEFKDRIEKYGIWAFELSNWDLPVYHPTNVLETGYDILFFWVARMILMSTSLLGEIPFKTVYLHGLVRDKDRQKMSKSKGNVIDPLGVIDPYGTDALRFAMIFSTAAGNDIPLAEDKIKGMKHFGNKLWNIARFILANVENVDSDLTINDIQPQTEGDKVILEKLRSTIKEVSVHIDEFRLHEAAQALYQFTWHEFADIYIEVSKQQLKDPDLKQNTEQVLIVSLITILKLLHPFMPFITEEIWSKLKQKDLLLIAEWPK